jgi:predicted alpha/beta hydrolase family esterase
MREAAQDENSRLPHGCNCSKERCEYFAQAWGSELSFIEDHGHINASAGFGAWPEGLNQLKGWIKTL